MRHPERRDERAFLRHATSKIEKAEDLDSLYTLGFRGEALASIAAVSRTELITKTADEQTGTKVALEGSDVVSVTPVGCPDGTTITVRDLFYNTPARRKFLSTQAAETGRVTALITRMAMAYPSVKFRMISNDNILFSTRGTGDRLDAIITIFGRSDTRSLLSVDYEADGVKVEGYVSGVGVSKPNRSGQIFFVNGRDVESKVVESGLESAYKERLFEGRYPIGYLFIDVASDTLDVNIHPNKKQVRFDDEKKVIRTIQDAVRLALETKEAAPQLDIKTPGRASERRENYQISASRVSEQSSAPSYIAKPREEFRPAPEKQVDVKELLSTFRKDTEQAVKEIESGKERIEETKEQTRLLFASLDVKGVIFDTYIVCQDEDDFYLIDQHAAHERVFFERFKERMERGEDLTQQILTPITVDARKEPGDWMLPLSELGFDIEEFGPATYIVRGIPTVFDISQAEMILKDYIDTCDDLIGYESSYIRDRLAMKACKSAVKANDILKDEEIERLLVDLDGCTEPYSCPHGRPTYIRMSKYDIERRFKRT